MVDRDVTFSTIFDESQAIMNRPGTALKGLGRPFSPPLLCAVYSKHKYDCMTACMPPVLTLLGHFFVMSSLLVTGIVQAEFKFHWSRSLPFQAESFKASDSDHLEDAITQ